ncbi:hypothetical protein DUNSADRAFT_3995 [Dunaliella salina]|uniref:MYND-type domain-containing protein n=1 Tax=Dunaliella salina TaxID=3046 RepID=A0ABQ7FV25_DUNSA|nr:hypothetical protein DUNSADRAFT_3995 [Dunaliella salina]|eukprot:KAF5826245.1 hypothetical protein DUNSADRAFT_3995 [Dunaliella salina]
MLRACLRLQMLRACLCLLNRSVRACIRKCSMRLLNQGQRLYPESVSRNQVHPRKCPGTFTGSRPHVCRCVLFDWMACEGSAASEGVCECCGVNQDMGNLVFVDPTTRHYIVVETDTGARMRETLESHAVLMANTLFNVARYIGYDPIWVRHCTYEVSDGGLPEGITNPDKAWTRDCEFGEVNAARCVGTLHPKVIDKIDEILQRDDFVAERAESNRKEAGTSKQELRKKVFSANVAPLHFLPDHKLRYKTKGTAPAKHGKNADSSTNKRQQAPTPKIANNSSTAAKPKPSSQLSAAMEGGSQKQEPRCSFCRKTAAEARVPKLLKCGNCRAAYYCSREPCQRSDYKVHKLHCQPPAV